MPFARSASHHICNEAMPNSLRSSAQMLRHDGIDSPSHGLRSFVVVSSSTNCLLACLVHTSFQGLTDPANLRSLIIHGLVSLQVLV